MIPSAFFRFLLTRPSRGATSARAKEAPDRKNFYSHAPRGARHTASPSLCRLAYFYSHAPRGARLVFCHMCSPQKYFYSHAPRGARLELILTVSLSNYFYSHAPRGARHPHPLASRPHAGFLLTRPSRGATLSWPDPFSYQLISTHTPLAGRDICAVLWDSGPQISTHTPLAGRDATISNITQVFKFLLTRPSRGATKVRAMIVA